MGVPSPIPWFHPYKDPGSKSDDTMVKTKCCLFQGKSDWEEFSAKGCE